MARYRLPMLGVFLFLAMTDFVHAQRREPGYQRSSGISPYLSLFNSNVGGTNSYFQFLRPQQQMEKFMRDASRQAVAQQQFTRQATTSLERSVLDAIRGEGNLRTGMLQQRPSAGQAFQRSAATFGNTARFFPQGSNAPPRR